MPLTVLPSGLTVVTDPMATVETVAAGVWVNAGTRSEAADEHGVAHFLEHMAFKGTRKRSARAISEVIEAVGGEINAATSVDTTAYHARMLADDLPLAIDVLADILTDPLFAPEDVGLEANVILQEIGAAEDVPEDRAFDAFPEAAFAGQPIGRRILGTRESVAAMDRDRLATFFGRNYTADQMIVAAAGRVDHDRLVGMVDKAFAGISRKAAGAPVPARYTGGLSHDDHPASECQFILGFAGEPATRVASVAAHIAAMALGGGLSSRLFQTLREERGLCYDTSAFHWAFMDCGLFGIHLAAAPGEMAEAVPVVLDEIEKALSTISDEETARAKAQMRAGLLMSMESVASRMGQAARQALLFGRLRPLSERLEEIESVGAEHARAALADIAASQPTVVAVGDMAAPDPRAVMARFGGSAAARGAA